MVRIDADIDPAMPLDGIVYAGPSSVIDTGGPAHQRVWPWVLSWSVMTTASGLLWIVMAMLIAGVW